MPPDNTYFWCEQRSDLCQDDCQCCEMICQDMGCSQEVNGGACYPEEQADMDCISGDNLCKTFEDGEDSSVLTD